MPRPENIRVTFWGTRGSCPTFPATWEVEEYARRVAEATLGAVFETFADHLKSGKSIDELLTILEHDPEELQRDLTIPELPVFGGETSCVEVETSDGNTLILDHGFGVRTFFGHTKEIHVEKGQEVERGQLVALIGNSGRSTGPHLHYVVEVDGKPHNPIDYIFD